MLNSNFVITLVTILAALVCLFQGEIKEAYHPSNPLVYNSYPYDGTIKKPGFSYWGGQGIQLGERPVERVFDPTGVDINKENRTLGSDFSKLSKLQPRHRNSVHSVHSGNYVKSVERYSDSIPQGIEVEARRNMQPLVGGASRFMVTGPKLNHYAPIDMAQHAVDTDNPIVDYGCRDVYSASGQLLKKAATRENYEDAQVKLPCDMMGMYGKNTEHFAQPVVIDRIMFASKKSRLNQYNDQIRGSLRIAPKYYGYFDVAVNPNLDLSAGYFVQHSKRGKEVPEMCSPLGLDEDNDLTHGRNHELSVTWGTDAQTESKGL